VRLVHAVEPVGEEPSPAAAAAAGATDEIIAAAESYACACAGDVEIAGEALPGEPVSRLVDESARAAVVVVGNRGPGGLRVLLGGSVAARTAVQARCPLVVVRPCRAPAPGDLDPHHGVGRVVVGVDESVLSRVALAFAFEEAALRGIGLAAVHAWRYPVSTSTGDLLFASYERLEPADDGHRLLTAALAPFRARFPQVPVDSVAVPAVSPAAALLHESGGAQLLVVGSCGRGGFAALLHGSVRRAAIHHASCPVAVIRP
jgi:nucleotide-binding universal stress UspA family protein